MKLQFIFLWCLLYLGLKPKHQFSILSTNMLTYNRVPACVFVFFSVICHFHSAFSCSDTAVFVLHILPHLVLSVEDDDVDDDYAEGVRLRLWTAAANVSNVYPPRWYMSMSNHGGWCRLGETPASSTRALTILPVEISGSKQEEWGKLMRI
jgi:hypothetical protein